MTPQDTNLVAHVIALPHEDIAALSASCRPHGFTPMRVPAIGSHEVAVQQDMYSVRWNHPSDGERVIDGLRFHAYRSSSRDPLAREACFWSHFHLWRRCALDDIPFIVFESDVIVTRRLDRSEIDPRFGMVSLNDPRGATRKAAAYHAALQAAAAPIVPVPTVDAPDVPQGLPGHSAYVLQPWFARELVAKVHQVGAMPNDALACQQFFPGGKLGAMRNYVTKVSGRPSLLR